MSAETLEVVAKTAGLAGIAILLVFGLFRNVINQKIFPNLSEKQGFSVIRMIIIAAGLLAVILLPRDFVA